nr:TrkA C-terminal domain-containing protein [Romboutsia lituseburensis]
MEISIPLDSKITNKSIKNIDISKDILIVMIKRNGNIIIPNGSTVIRPEDVLVITGNNLDELENLSEI